MEYVQYESAGNVAVIRLNRPKANAINREMIAAMTTAFDKAERESAAIVWSSAVPRFFSAGFDVNEVFTYDEPQMHDFLTAFSALQQRVLHSPKPTVAALPGQTYAGGAILALSCDVRVMADGPFGFALTEVNIGVNLPAQIYHLLASSVGHARAKTMFLSGEAISAQEAQMAGLVTLAPEDAVEARAIDFAVKLADKPPQTYASIKRTILEAIGLAPTSHPVADASSFFSAEARDFKAQLAAKLAGR